MGNLNLITADKGLISSHLTIAESARYTGVNQETIRRWYKQGLISGIKLAGIVAIDKTSLDKQMVNYKPRPEPMPTHFKGTGLSRDGKKHYRGKNTMIPENFMAENQAKVNNLISTAKTYIYIKPNGEREIRTKSS